ncbi:MAG: DUF169 domain-containing protein [Muribaculaceae bacterium]|nr:DUF169 domain-containing protein [Muribaculaceae bacterium]
MKTATSKVIPRSRKPTTSARSSKPNAGIFDTTDVNAVQSPFGSGCSSTITSLVNENRRGGKHCFIGMLDVSARPYFRPDVLSFSIPLSRFREMADTLSRCCVAGAPAWMKVRKRINRS